MGAGTRVEWETRKRTGLDGMERWRNCGNWEIMAMVGAEELLKEELRAGGARDGRGRPAVVRAGLQLLLK